MLQNIGERKRRLTENEPEKLERRRERELKKLEDCWTKDSIDLNRASKEDGLCTRSRSRNTPTKSDPFSPEQEDAGVPESSEADSQEAQTELINAEEHNDKTQQTPKRQLFDDFNKSLNGSSSTKTSSIVDLTDETDPQPDLCSLTTEDDKTMVPTKLAKEIKSEMKPEKSKPALEEEDDSPTKGMPHLKQFLQVKRKKLRSEVTNTELWEGFPVDIKMPRLKPRSSSESNKQVAVNKDRADLKHRDNDHDKASFMTLPGAIKVKSLLELSQQAAKVPTSLHSQHSSIERSTTAFTSQEKVVKLENNKESIVYVAKFSNQKIKDTMTKTDVKETKQELKEPTAHDVNATICDETPAVHTTYIVDKNVRVPISTPLAYRKLLSVRVKKLCLDKDAAPQAKAPTPTSTESTQPQHVKAELNLPHHIKKQAISTPSELQKKSKAPPQAAATQQKQKRSPSSLNQVVRHEASPARQPQLAASLKKLSKKLMPVSKSFTQSRSNVNTADGINVGFKSERKIVKVSLIENSVQNITLLNSDEIPTQEQEADEYDDDDDSEVDDLNPDDMDNDPLNESVSSSEVTADSDVMEPSAQSNDVKGANSVISHDHSLHGLRDHEDYSKRPPKAKLCRLAIHAGSRPALEPPDKKRGKKLSLLKQLKPKAKLGRPKKASTDLDVTKQLKKRGRKPMDKCKMMINMRFKSKPKITLKDVSLRKPDSSSDSAATSSTSEQKQEEATNGSESSDNARSDDTANRVTRLRAPHNRFHIP